MFTPVSRVVVSWVLGAIVGTVLWFTLSPVLSDGQEALVGWLLMGSYAVVVGVVLLRRRRRTDPGPPG
jgi:hypothetical protein